MKPVSRHLCYRMLALIIAIGIWSITSSALVCMQQCRYSFGTRLSTLKTASHIMMISPEKKYEIKMPPQFMRFRQQESLQLHVQLEESESEVSPVDYKELESYFNRVVSPGAEITYDNMVAFPQIAKLVSDGLIFPDDIKDLWISTVGDATGLNLEEAYEFANMVSDLPDPEDLEYFNSEFDKLVNEKETLLPFYKFLGWEGVQDVVKEGVLSIDEITDIYKRFAKDLSTPIDRTLFLAINNAIDDEIDNRQAEDEEDSDDSDGGIDISNVDIWSKDFDPTIAFDKETLQEISMFWKANAKKSTSKKTTGKSGPEKLSKDKFMAWADIQEIIEEGLISQADIEKAWEKAAKSSKTIDFDTFLRLNISIDILLDEAEEAAGDTSEDSANDNNVDDGKSFYFTEFEKLADGLQFITIDQLLGWEEVQGLLSEGAVTRKQITALYNSFPSAAGDGLTKDEFVALNNMLDIMLDKGDGPGDDGSSTSSKVVSATPTALVSEPARPMPAVSELKMGSLETSSNDGSNEADIEMMEALDQADNLLNSGSFRDFDALIGDENDPRLELKAKLSALEVPLEVKESRDKLLTLSRGQSRGGLDRPSEDDETLLRSYAQTIADKAAKAADLDIGTLRSALTGRWKLLYTNSEMFNFYNGITGFANVFPGTTFQDLTLEYTSDGYLNEGKFLENLKTPVGNTVATVYSNWELLKETSFMTNENSVILRGYCNKVTAGPMTYEAQENWKSLRTMSMNELVYIDDRIMLMRNAGALRIFFVYERI